MNRNEYLPAQPAYESAVAAIATRGMTLAESAGLLARLIADACLMGGEI